jgi:YggT family protein
MENTAVALVNIFTMTIEVVIWGLIVWAVASWLVAFNIVNTRNRFVSGVLDALDRIYGPMVRPIRRFLPDFGGIDLSPLVLWLLLRGVQILVPALAIDATGLLQ